MDEDNIGPRFTDAQREVIDQLWSMGLTVTPRQRWASLYDAPNPPPGMAYQWMNGPAEGWTPVMSTRHAGMFAPYHDESPIWHAGSMLMERPKAEVAALQAEAHMKAQQNIDDWYARQGAAGLTGHVRVMSEGSDIPQSDATRHVNPETKTIESKTKIPPDMIPFMREIFIERDRLWNEGAMKPWEPGNELYDRFAKHSIACPELPRGAVMNAILMPIAIENVRRITKGVTHDDTEVHAQPGHAEART